LVLIVFQLKMVLSNFNHDQIKSMQFFLVSAFDM